MISLPFTQLGNRPYKERRTATHVFFVGGPFSQWWSSQFVASAHDGYPEEKFSSAEQYMMAGKALLFGDEAVYFEIMRTHNPKAIKELGRQVRGREGRDDWNTDDIAYWNAKAREIVLKGSLAKYGQNTDLLQYLLDTNDLYLVEGAWYDAVWGVKLAFDDPLIDDPANWKGLNWLGETLMEVRKTMRNY